MYTARIHHSVAFEVEEGQDGEVGFALGKSIDLSKLIGHKVRHGSFRLKYPDFILYEAPF